jgi:VanZ family protein
VVLLFQRPDNFDKVMGRVFLASVLYGIAIEVAQELFTATRHADFFDVMANTTGAFIAVAVIMIVNFTIKENNIK